MSSRSTIDSSKYVFSICKPLFKKLGLNAFSYSKIYIDGSRSELWSDIEAMEHSFFGRKHIEKIYTPEFLQNENIVIYEKKILTYPPSVQGKLQSQLKDQKEIFNHDNALLIAMNNGDHFEYFFFYTPRDASNAVNMYLSNMEELKNFCNYFRKRARDLILKVDQAKLISAWRNPCGTKINQISDNQNQKFDQNYLNELTKREKEIGYLLVEGKTAREVGEILFISKRTAELHIANIKDKLNCRKKSELIWHFISNGT